MESKELQAFKTLVELKYDLYNSLFLKLPFPNLEEAGMKLPLFAESCKEGLNKDIPPQKIVDSFFAQNFSVEKKMDILFLFTQFIERQIVLFDALEQAAFNEIHRNEQSGTLKYFIARCREGHLKKELKATLKEYRTRVVLTAHPTQFYPEVILTIIDQFAQAIDKNDLIKIEETLLQLGMTSFRNKTAPTPLSEAEQLIRRYHRIFYKAIVSIESALDEGLGDKRSPNSMIEVGFWPGGDRDGNPNVTVEMTLEVANQLRRAALENYKDELSYLKTKLTFPGVTDQLAKIEKKLDSYENPEDMLREIDQIEKTIIDHYKGLFSEDVQRFKRGVRSFGFHFASLDIRQDSSAHEEVVATILRKVQPHADIQYEILNPNEKGRLLEELLEKKPIKPLEFPDNPLVTDCLGSLKAIEKIQKSNGYRGAHRYIVSNTQGAHNLIEVLFLMHLIGLDQLKLDIIPLFETINDLESSVATMEALYESAHYRKHLMEQGAEQTIMVGFSDGTKDGGYVSCNWEIFKAKKRLQDLGEAQGVKTLFFDGRGGPPARGGGNTHRFYRAVGANINQRQVQLTIQGQTISSKFGTVDAAKENLEQLFTAGLESQLFYEEETPMTQEETNILEELSEISFNAYQNLRQDPLFISFLEKRTPLAHLSKLNVASRPGKRGKTDDLTLEDLRAIPFVSAWSQIKLNVPGFYGLGTALNRLMKNGKESELKNLYQENLFFSTLIDNSMQALAKSNLLFTAHLLDDSKFGSFIKKLHDEARLAENKILEITGQTRLLQNDPVNAASIKLREQLILPLTVIQQYALANLNKKESDLMEKLLLKTLPSIINAGRNSA